VLFVEILNDDLDFEVSSRSNKEILKNIMTKKAERSGISRELTPSVTTVQPRRHPPDASLAALGQDDSSTPGTEDVIQATPVMTDMTQSFNEEEMDLVEQLYGTEKSLRSTPIDLSESIVLPPTLKNKELDMVAWSRSSIHPSPLGVSESGPLRPPSTSTDPQVGHQLREDSKSGHTSAVLSLDEYSERMQTAAIMLSQLNANIVREPFPVAAVPGISANIQEIPPTSGVLNWLIASSWLGQEIHQSTDKGLVHPSLTSRPHETNMSNLPTRMRLQYAEAAAIRDRIMKEMLLLEEERMKRMRENRGDSIVIAPDVYYGMKTAQDDGIIRRELNKADPSSVIFSESWAAKKARQSRLPYSLMY
jgi:phosphatidylinositol 4-kinase